MNAGTFIGVWAMDKADKVPSLMKHVVLVYCKAWLEIWERRAKEKKGIPGRGNSKSKHTEAGNSLLLSPPTLSSLLPHSQLSLEAGRNNDGEGYAIGLSSRHTDNFESRSYDSPVCYFYIPGKKNNKF